MGQVSGAGGSLTDMSNNMAGVLYVCSGGFKNMPAAGRSHVSLMLVRPALASVCVCNSHC